MPRRAAGRAPGMPAASSPVARTNDSRPGRLRVLAFTSIFPNAEQPGHGLFVRERLRAMARLCDVRVAAPVPWSPPLPGLPDRYRAYGRVPSIERHGALRVYHPRFGVVPKALKWTDGLLMAASCGPALEWIRRRFPFDVLDAHWAYPDGFAAAVLARRLGVPVAITVRGDDINVFAHQTGRRRFIRWALASAQLVVAVSRPLRDAVLELTDGAARVAVVPNGIDPARFSPMDRLDARRSLGLPAGGRLVMAVGRLHASKGYAVLVEAVGRLIGRFPDLSAAIIGEPDPEADATPAIRSAARRFGLENRLLMPGGQTAADLRRWYSAADVFALPTAREGSPNAVLEALACGLPCVTTPVGGLVDIMTDPALGRLVEPTAAAFAVGLAWALEQPWDRGRIAALGRQRTWDVVAAECVAHLSRIVAARPRRPVEAIA